MERLADAAAARESEERQRLETAARRQADAQRAQQQFNASLNSLNPGQLFAKADELRAQDPDKSREVLRALMSCFPGHSLAIRSADSLAGVRAATLVGHLYL